MTPASSNKERIRRIIYFFPFQLFFVQIKKNILLLVAWGILLGFISNGLAVKYGVPNLFLSPEYHGFVGFWSFFIMGICVGAFIMTFNIASYVTNGSRFPFLATLNRPFLKYSINNLIIPFGFLLYYSWSIVKFQIINEYQDRNAVLLDLCGLYLGMLVFMSFSYIYFFSTNKNLFQLFGIKPASDAKETMAKLKDQPIRKNPIAKFLVPTLKWVRAWKVITYLPHPFAVRLARESAHYEKAMIVRVFTQNQNNAAWFQLLIFVILIIMGYFQDISYLQIPAGGSIILFFTMVLIIITVLQTWLRGWFPIAFVGLALLVNNFSKYDILSFDNSAYGLNYNNAKAIYSNEVLEEHTNNLDQYIKDVSNTKTILEKWKKKNQTKNNPKPKMVIICASGGGIKSSVWTFQTLHAIDSITKGDFFKKTHLLTGSSGGTIGLSYYRELYLQQLNGIDIPSYKEQLNNIGKDLLNPVASSFTLYDLIFKLKKFDLDGYTYTKDRGYAFEEQLNKNTNYIMNNKISYYKEKESESLIPMLILSPAIVNDGRRLIISSQPVSYLVHNNPSKQIINKPTIEQVEFTRFFANQDANNLRFTSALRMNATFPYIMPLVTLPSEPAIEIIDAGARDNFGLKTAIKYIYTFRKWLEENTSGIIIAQIRERPKDPIIGNTKRRTALGKIITPIGSFYNNLFNIQDYNNDELIQYASEWYNGRIDIIDFQLRVDQEPRISLSWHLTNREKKQIAKALFQKQNVDAMRKLDELLN
ncbi:MAG TPA: hypothetical protein EYN89_00950 [Flavobacteriales bacterium]|nr:hypothetical protein [Flavobacteriales bacterium]